jgi:hypothetical protein
VCATWREVDEKMDNEVTTHNIYAQSKFFIHQLMHKRIVLKTILKFTLKLTLIYLLTPWSRVLLEKLTGSAASQ